MQRHYSKYRKFILVMQPTTLNYQLHKQIRWEKYLSFYILFLKEFKEDTLTIAAYHDSSPSDFFPPSFSSFFFLSHRYTCSLGGFPGATAGEEPACHCRRCKRHRFDPWISMIPWKKACQLQCSGLENPTDKEAWWATVHEVAKVSDTTEAP